MLFLENIKKLKSSGIEFSVNYTIEFTQDKKVIEEIEKKGIFDNVKKYTSLNIEECIKMLVNAQQQNIPILYMKLFIDITINNITVFEDNMSMFDIPMLKTDISIQEQNKELNNELSLYQEFIKKYNCNDIFKEFSNNL